LSSITCPVVARDVAIGTRDIAVTSGNIIVEKGEYPLRLVFGEREGKGVVVGVQCENGPSNSHLERGRGKGSGGGG
jgi:hypothetical protein